MQVGDIIKIVESVRHNKTIKKKNTTGKIIAIDNKITICRTNKNGDKWNISYTLGDLKDRTKEFYIKNNEGWAKLKISIKGSGGNDL